jgi:hypothetical protein
MKEVATMTNVNSIADYIIFRLKVEGEEHHKNLVIDFLNKTYYQSKHYINTKGRKDLVIHNGNDSKSSVGVVIEAKKPTNKSEMLTTEKVNVKAFHELVLYYLRERITHKNLEIKNVIATSINEWFIFDSGIFEKHFAQNKSFVKQFEDFEAGRLSGTNTDFFYSEIAKPYIEGIETEISFTHFDIRNYEKPLRNDDLKDDNKLISLFKLLSPEHLLKLPFANDSNSLDKRFYSELLHIIGLTETKEKGKKLINRHKEGERNSGSLLENAITQLNNLDKIDRVTNPSQYGATQSERLFNVGLELCITWVNRILFLKLLEAQLLSYHKGDATFEFLSFDKVHNYDDLNGLFFEVLAKKHHKRDEEVQSLFSKVPYLNSSLFEPTELEHETVFISNLKDDKKIPILSGTVLKSDKGKKRTGELTTLEYLFEFLGSYDFSSEGSENIQEDNKTLINASVLGLIFEKINGYKDGSFFTPGFITMYMCKETIRKAVIQKFNEVNNWTCKNFDELYDKIEDRQSANETINSLKICDPAVGSGHFLVSALNEIIAIKHDLRLLQDHENKRLKEYTFEVVNDELIVTDDDGQLFEYSPNNKESQRVQVALFHEKQTIIENCLFGVDINPNSVKICRLRLWIELLKNAYYKTETELETLPNIDINIKCGNSLISRFDIDANLGKALKKSKWTIESYRLAVDSYRNAQSKEEKREMERLIDSIKNDFRSEISSNDPKILRYQKLNGELFKITNQAQLFELSRKEKIKWNKDVKKLTDSVNKLNTEIEEIKSNKIYENAFEWRFEFPEVLNEKGDFVGFDVVIGNPPYGVTLQFEEINYYRNSFKTIVGHAEVYYIFIEKSLKLCKNGSLISFIVPNAWLTNKYAMEMRNRILNKHGLVELINFNQTVVFEDAQVETCILTLVSRVPRRIVTVGHSLLEKYNYKINSWLKDENLLISFSQNPEIQSILDTVNDQKHRLSNVLDISNGCKPYQVGYGKNLEGLPLDKEDVRNRIYHAQSKLTTDYLPELKGKDVNRYQIKDVRNWLLWGNWLMSPKDAKYHFRKKILIRQIIGKSFICAIDETENIADQSLYIGISLDENNIPLETCLAILNSKLYGFFFRKYYSEDDDLFPKIKVNELKRLPFKKPSPEISKILSNKVNTITENLKKDSEWDKSKLEQEIDQIVYSLYGLSPKEIKIVENSFI